MKIRIDTYYDITCDCCGRSWSTDFNVNEGRMSRFRDGGMGMEMDKKLLSKMAYSSGWKCKAGRTLCPDCLKDRRH